MVRSNLVNELLRGCICCRHVTGGRADTTSEEKRKRQRAKGRIALVGRRSEAKSEDVRGRRMFRPGTLLPGRGTRQSRSSKREKFPIPSILLSSNHRVSVSSALPASHSPQVVPYYTTKMLSTGTVTLAIASLLFASQVDATTISLSKRDTGIKQANGSINLKALRQETDRLFR